MAEQAANDNNAQAAQVLSQAQQPTLSLDAAFNNIVQVVRQYRGTADDHDALKLSLQVIWNASHPAPVAPVEAPAAEASSESAN